MTVSKDKSVVATEGGQLATEEYRSLMTKGAKEYARVNMAVSESLEYGSLKVSASVTLACDQTEAKINMAGELAFNKAVELVKDGFKSYGYTSTPEETRGKNG